MSGDEYIFLSTAKRLFYNFYTMIKKVRTMLHLCH